MVKDQHWVRDEKVGRGGLGVCLAMDGEMVIV
jgi:hypothetical protein